MSYCIDYADLVAAVPQVMSPVGSPSADKKPINKRWTLGGKSSKPLPPQLSNTNTVMGMVAVIDKDACYICLSKFGVTKRKVGSKARLIECSMSARNVVIPFAAARTAAPKMPQG